MPTKNFNSLHSWTEQSLHVFWSIRLYIFQAVWHFENTVEKSWETYFIQRPVKRMWPFRSQEPQKWHTSKSHRSEWGGEHFKSRTFSEGKWLPAKVWSRPLRRGQERHLKPSFQSSIFHEATSNKITFGFVQLPVLRRTLDITQLSSNCPGMRALEPEVRKPTPSACLYTQNPKDSEMQFPFSSWLDFFFLEEILDTFYVTIRMELLLRPLFCPNYF